MSRDPKDGRAQDPASLHKYLYANGDPLNRIDPRGREASVSDALAQAWSRVTTFVEAHRFEISLTGCMAGIVWSLYELADEHFAGFWGGIIPGSIACFDTLVPLPPFLQ
jgi:hypothetical protein